MDVHGTSGILGAVCHHMFGYLDPQGEVGPTALIIKQITVGRIAWSQGWAGSLRS